MEIFENSSRDFGADLFSICRITTPVQKAYIRCDLKVVFDFGDLWIHRSALLLSGKSVWWASLLKESCSDVVILPGVTQVEVDKFILTVYGQNIVTEDKYSSDTEPFH